MTKLEQLAEKAVMVCPQCEGEGSYADGLDEAACSTECARCGGNGWIVDLAALRAAGEVEAEYRSVIQQPVIKIERGGWSNHHYTDDGLIGQRVTDVDCTHVIVTTTEVFTKLEGRDDG